MKNTENKKPNWIEEEDEEPPYSHHTIMPSKVNLKNSDNSESSMKRTTPKKDSNNGRTGEEE